FAKADQLRSILADVMAQDVDVIVAGGPEAAQRAALATKTIPIVMVHGDPVRAGLVASLARPGGNITGTATHPTPALMAKRVELMKQIKPQVSRVAMLFEPGQSRAYQKDVEVGARAAQVTLDSFELREASDLQRVFTDMLKKHCDAIVVQS